MGQINLNVSTRSVFGTLKTCTTKETYSTIDSPVIIARIAQTANMKENDVRSALLGVTEATRYFALNGHTVKFGDFGSFRIGLNVASVAQASQCSADLISKVGLNYTPSAKIKSALSNISFNS